MSENTQEYLLDTSCWMEWYNQTKTGKKIEKFLHGKTKFTPSSVIGELRKNIKDENFFKMKSFVLGQSETINCDDNISEFAGQLKKDLGGSRISWVDFVIIATAKVKDLKVCSTDHHFDGFKNIINVKIFEKS